MTRLTLQPFLRIGWGVGVMILASTIAFHQPFLSRSMMFAIVVVALKIAADLYSHLAERRAFRPGAGAGL